MDNRNIPVNEQQNEQGSQQESQQGADVAQGERTGGDAEIHQLRDQLLRTVADMENMRRRNLQQQQQTVQFANESLLREILPIFDDLNRSVDAGAASRDFESFYTGVQMIVGKLQKTLEKLNVKTIPAVGANFDVNLHEAIMSQPSEQPEGTILVEVDPGYTYGDRVLRHSKVIVSAGN